MKKIDFSNNLNTLGPPKNLKKILRENIEALYSYPESEDEELLKVLAKFSGIRSQNISLGNGSTEIFFTLPQILPQGKILIVIPTFWEYAVANERIKGNQIISFKLDEKSEFKLDIDKFKKKIKESAPAVVYLCNPNNPTSTLISKKLLLTVIKTFPQVKFVIDEAYLFFQKKYKELSLINEAVNLGNLYVVSSFSKFFAIAGLRFGYLISNKKNVALYRKFRTPYASNPLLKVAIPHLVSEIDFIKATRIFYAKQRQDYFRLLKKRFEDRLKVYFPEANFIFCQLLTNISSTNLVKKLANDGILVRDASIYKGLSHKWIRFCIREDKANAKLVNSLDKYL